MTLFDDVPRHVCSKGRECFGHNFNSMGIRIWDDGCFALDACLYDSVSGEYQFAQFPSSIGSGLACGDNLDLVKTTQLDMRSWYARWKCRSTTCHEHRERWVINQVSETTVEIDGTCQVPVSKLFQYLWGKCLEFSKTGIADCYLMREEGKKGLQMMFAQRFSD